MISFQLLSAIQELTTAFENTPMQTQVITDHKNSTKYALFSAKTASRTVSPIVTVTFSETGLSINTKLYADYDPLTHQYSKDYIFFSEFTSKTFTEYEFIIANKDFWIRNGYLGLEFGF